jgi:hypothetical protein
MYSVNDSDFQSVCPRLQAPHNAYGLVTAKLIINVKAETLRTLEMCITALLLLHLCFPNPWRYILAPSTPVMHYTVSMLASDNNQVMAP